MVAGGENDCADEESVVGGEDVLILGDEEVVGLRRGGRVEQEHGRVGLPQEANVVEPDVHRARRRVRDERDLQEVHARIRETRVRVELRRSRPRARSGETDGPDGRVGVGIRRQAGERPNHGDEEPSGRQAARDFHVESDNPGVWHGATDLERLHPVSTGTRARQTHLEVAACIPSRRLVRQRRTGPPCVGGPIPVEVEGAVHGPSGLDPLDPGDHECRTVRERRKVRDRERNEADERQRPQDGENRSPAGRTRRGPIRPRRRRKAAPRTEVPLDGSATPRARPSGRGLGGGDRRRTASGTEAAPGGCAAAHALHAGASEDPALFNAAVQGCGTGSRHGREPARARVTRSRAARIYISNVGSAALRPTGGGFLRTGADGMEYDDRGRRNADVQFETIRAEKVNFGRNNFLEVARKRATTSEGAKEFISVSRGYYLPDKTERFKRSLTIPDDAEVRAFVAEKIRSM